MKKIALVVIVALLSACTSKTEYGDCVGLLDEKKADLTYKMSAWNIALGIIFFGLIAPPVFVVVNETFCPVAKK